jgi:hypothetical protein
MQSLKTVRSIAIVLAISATLCGAQTQKADQWKEVETALGRQGKPQPDGTLKFGMPRTDLKVTVNGVSIKPALALGSWIAFAGSPDKAMVMGDLVLTEDEVAPVMLKLQQEGIQQTGLHNHLLHETPRIMYMHVGAQGNSTAMAKAIHDALALTGTPSTTSATPPATEQNIGIDVGQISSIIGHKGTANGGVYQIGVPRPERITDGGMEIPPSMGTATALNFQPMGQGRAAITGDFVLLASEVNPVIRTLRNNGIQVTALHSHMLDDQPHLFFMHFWANDDALKLARGLRSALDQTHMGKTERAGKQ